MNLPLEHFDFGAIDTVTIRGADGSSATISHLGGQVLSWKTADGQERLYMSPLSCTDGSVPLRGGIPICFPQFANLGPLTKHGFARTTWWRVEGRNDDSSRARFVLQDSDLPSSIRSSWPHRFRAQLDVSLKQGALCIGLAVFNMGEAPFAWTGALHTYLRVADIASARVLGLMDCPYRDNADPRNPWFDVDGGLGFRNEVERLFKSSKQIHLRDVTAPVGDSPSSVCVDRGSIAISVDGFGELMVWNPGPSARFADLPPDDYREFICIEPAVVDQPVVLEPGQTWRGSAVFSVRD